MIVMSLGAHSVEKPPEQWNGLQAAGEANRVWKAVFWEKRVLASNPRIPPLPPVASNLSLRLLALHMQNGNDENGGTVLEH